MAGVSIAVLGITMIIVLVRRRRRRNMRADVAANQFIHGGANAPFFPINNGNEQVHLINPANDEIIHPI